MQKDIAIKLEVYGMWFVVNLLSLLPIGIAVIWGMFNNSVDWTVMFSSIVASIFGLLIMSIYGYFPIFKNAIGQETLFITSLVFISLVTLLFVFYNASSAVQKFFNEHPASWLFLLIPLLMVFILNLPALKSRCQDKEAASRTPDLGPKRRDGWKNDIQGRK